LYVTSAVGEEPSLLQWLVKSYYVLKDQSYCLLLLSKHGVPVKNWVFCNTAMRTPNVTTTGSVFSIILLYSEFKYLIRGIWVHALFG